MRSVARIITGAFFCLGFIWSCTVNGGQWTPDPVFRAVPSDAIAFAFCSDASCAEDYFSEGSPLLALDLENTDGPAIVVWGFNGSVQQMLCIGIPGDVSSPEDSLFSLKMLKSTASRKGMYTYSGNTAGGRVFAVSPSENMISVLRTHLASGSSVLEAGRFMEAARTAGNSDALFIRADALRRLVPRKPWNIPVPRSTVVNFFSGAADWYVITRGDKPEIFPVRGEGASYYANILEQMPAAESELILPRGCSHALTMTVDLPACRELRESWLDACGRITSYRTGLDTLTRLSGTNPLNWEKSADVREVSVLSLHSGDTLVIMRTARPVDCSMKLMFRYPEVLYGKVFALPETSEVLTDGCMVICGKKSAINEYVTSPKEEDKFCKGPCRVALKCGSTRIVSGAKSTVYKNLKEWNTSQ